MRVLVAGGAGFVGEALCRRLLARGDQVVCVDNLVTGSIDHVARLSAATGFTFVEADVTSTVEVDGPVEAVVNLACPASPADFGPLALEILAVGSVGVSNLADLAAARGARFVQASTSEVYGDPLVHPQPESYWGNVDPVGARSPYDEAKRFGEALTMAHHHRHGTDVGVVRIFNTYGPGMRPDDGRVVSNLVSQALAAQPLTVHGDGSQTRSFCFVEDLVGALIAMVDSGAQGPVNIGSDEERTIAEVARLVLKVTGSSSAILFRPRPPGDPSRRCPDLTLARRELGWSPTTALRDGLARTVEGFAARVAARG